MEDNKEFIEALNKIAEEENKERKKEIFKALGIYFIFLFVLGIFMFIFA